MNWDLVGLVQVEKSGVRRIEISFRDVIPKELRSRLKIGGDL